MWKNKIKLRNLKADDGALLFALGIMVVLGIIFIAVLGNVIMNIAIGMFFIAVALILIAVAAKMLRKTLSGTKTGDLLKKVI